MAQRGLYLRFSNDNISIFGASCCVKYERKYPHFFAIGSSPEEKATADSKRRPPSYFCVEAIEQIYG